MVTIDGKRYLTGHEVSDSTGVKVYTVWRWMRLGHLACVFIGGVKHVEESQLVTLVKSGKEG